MKRTRQFAVIIIAMMIVLAGCAQSGPKDSPNNSNSGQASSPSPDKGTPPKQVKLKLQSWYNAQTDGWDKVIAEFESKHPNIKVEFVSAGDNDQNEYLKKLDLSAASGDDLDIIMTGSATALMPRVALNMFEPLDSYLDKAGIKVSEEDRVDTITNGKYYALPGKYTMQLVAINSAHLANAGLSVPKEWTWDEYLEYAKKMTKLDGEKKQYGTYFHSWLQFARLAQMNQFENSNLVMDDNKTANVNTPEMRKSLEIRRQAEQDKSATPYADVVSQKLNYRPQYFNQDASMIPVGSFIIPETGGTTLVPANFKTVFAPFPKFKQEDPMYTQVFSDTLSIYARSKNKEEAFTFIEWYTKEGIVLQGKYLPSWKKADLSEVVDRIMTDAQTPEMMDKESLIYVLENSVPSKMNIPVTYQPEVDKLLQEQFDLFMLKNQDLDATLEKSHELIQKLIDSKS